MKAKPLPTQDMLRKLFDYDRDLARLVWRRRFDLLPPRQSLAFNAQFAGRPAGKPDKNGYIIIIINGERWRAARLVWKWFHGNDPKGQIDHRDGNVTNDLPENLREATQQQNASNTGGWRKKLLPVGVQLRCDGKKYIAKIMVGRRYRHLGSFDTIKQAAEAYKKEAVLLRGEFAR